MPPALFVGIDPGESNRAAFSILDGAGNFVDAGFFEGPLPASLRRQVADRLAAGESVTIGINGPRCLLSQPRQWDWDREARRWRRLAQGLDAGRHAEIVLRAHGFLEGPWSGVAATAAPRQGYITELYQDCATVGGVKIHETCAAVASRSFDPGEPPPEPAEPAGANLRDATLAAATGREFLLGRGAELGGGDGLGSILLPRPLPEVIPEVLVWPEAPLNSLG